jgi:hypothetical protein
VIAMLVCVCVICDFAHNDPYVRPCRSNVQSVMQVTRFCKPISGLGYELRAPGISCSKVSFQSVFFMQRKALKLGQEDHSNNCDHFSF